jgi:hypothetical protein
MRALVAAALAGVLAGPFAPGLRADGHRELLQQHRAVSHGSPEHHLQEARRALDRAWEKASAAERRRLDPVRTHFAELALVYTKVPADPKQPDRTTAPQPIGTSGTQQTANTTAARPEPTGVGPGEPPNPSGAIPQPAMSTKPPAAWQMKYAVVEKDLKDLGSEPTASLQTRIDHFRTHLQMFYAAALGTPPR